MANLLFARGGPHEELSEQDLRTGLYAALDRLGPRKKVLVVPPDLTRFHSRAGELTRHAYEFYGDRLTDVLPAIGTHYPMTADEIERMFPGVPAALFRQHDFRNAAVTLGTVPAEFVAQVSEGAVSYPWPAQVGKLLVEGGFDLILSIGQVVPHEVAGMANYNKNLFAGTGGADGISRSHFLGAAYGMERIMGRADNPVRRVFNYGSKNFAAHLPVVYAHTVVARGEDGGMVTRGLFVGDGDECFTRAAELSLEVNFIMLDRPLSKVVVYLDPTEFRSTWLGNKSIYRTRMAIADGGELVVLGPAVGQFGEDPGIDALIRRYGYVGRERVLELVQRHQDLAGNLSAAAHLIHGSSDGRFTVTYCPGGLSKAETEGVGFRYGDLASMQKRYDPTRLAEGWNTLPDGEEIFYIGNPALGLWAHRDRF
jgi:nickel-dependent lactate racemase